MKTLLFDEIFPFFHPCRVSLFPEKITGVSTDTRTLKKGDLFFALSGARVDGHSFLNEAKRLGAAGAVVQQPCEVEGFPLITVPNVLEALQNLAKNLLKKFRPKKVIGVTGSCGKTTCKDFIKTVLSEKYQTASSLGNQNSEVGLPTSIINQGLMGEDILILEMGMTEKGHISKLIEIAPLDIALITSVFLCHAENFSDLREIRQAKEEIFLSPHLELGILSGDIEGFEETLQIGGFPKITFSLDNPKADFRLELQKDNLIFCSSHERVSLGSFPILGKHNRHNLLAAILAARALNLSWDEIRWGIKKLKLPEKRLELIQKGDKFFLNDSYNASPISLLAALDVMEEIPHKGRKIGVLGGMRELGPFSFSCHEEVGLRVLSSLETLFCLGEEWLPFKEEWTCAGKSVYFFKNKRELASSLKESLRANDLILLKGSCYYELWTLLDELGKT